MSNTNRYKDYILQICQEWHRTAEQIHSNISNKYPWSFIWLWTVYRNLTELVNDNHIMKQHWLMDKMVYEKKKDHHGHIFCQNSGVILDLDISKIPLDSVTIPDEFCKLDIQVTFAWYFKDTNWRFCPITGKKL